MSEPLFTHTYRACKLLGKEPSGHGDVRLAIELADGTTRTLFIDGFDVESFPSYDALFDFGVYWTFSDMFDHDIEYVSWATYCPKNRLSLSSAGG